MKDEDDKIGVSERLRLWSRRAQVEIVALLLAYRHRNTPWFAKLVAALVVAYALSPIDLIPDFIPVLGLLDDVILLPIGVAIAVRLIPSEILDECRRKAQDQDEKLPLSRLVVASLVVVLWISIVGGLALICWRVVS